MSLKLRFIPILSIILLASNMSFGQFAIESIVVKNISCFGGDDGEITVTVSGGVPPYRYEWIKLTGDIMIDNINSSETTVTFPGSVPIVKGNYYIRVRDNALREISEVRSITEPLALTTGIAPNPAEACTNADLQLDGNADFGTPPYTHSWTGTGATYLSNANIENPIFNSPASGNFDLTYTVTDNNGCITSENITVSVSDNPTTFAGTDDSTCGTDYTLNATASFGTGTWSASGPGSASFSNVNAPDATVNVSLPGVYTFTWAESNGTCSNSDDVVINLYERPDFSTILTNPSSAGATDGSIEINMTSGTAGYTYKLTDSSSNETSFGPTPNLSHIFSGLDEDVYTLEITDANGCIVTKNRELSAVAILSVDVQTTSTCAGSDNGSISIEILAGDNPFDVVVSTSPGGTTVFSSLATNDFNFLVENLAAGNFTINIEDNSGNIDNTNVTVTEGPSATISYTESPFCGEGEGFVTITGAMGGTFSASPAGLSINASTGTIDLTNSTNGTYTVSYAYGSGTCFATAQTTVVLGEITDVSISYDGTPYCQQTGGVADVTIVGQTLNSSSSTYTSGHIPTDFGFRSVTTSSTCPGLLSVNIPIGAVITSVDVRYAMTAISGHYKSDQRSQLRVVSPGGEAEPAVYSGSGNASGTQLYNRTGLTIANGVVGGGNINFELHAGRTFINTPACSASGNRVDDGTWTVTVHYTSGHEFSSDNPGLVIDQVTGQIDLENSLPGTYQVSYDYTEGACTGVATTSVTILEKPAAPVVVDENVCYTGTAHALTATPAIGASLVWYSTQYGSVVVSAPTGTEIGVYSAWAASVKDGCESDRVQGTLTIVESPSMPVPSNVNVCFDGNEHTASATVEAGANLLWYTTQTGSTLTVKPTATNPGLYTAWAAAEVDGCESERVEVTLTISDAPDQPTANNIEVCYDGTVKTATAIPPAGASVVYYTSETGSTTTTAPTATAPGTFTAWAASSVGSGCESDRVLVTLLINPLPQATISFNPAIACLEGTIQATITSSDNIISGTFSSEPETGLAFTDENLGIIDLSISLAGSYLIEYRFFDENGCFNTTTTSLELEATPDVPVANNEETCFDGLEHSASATPPAGATLEWYTTETGTVTTTAPTATSPGVYKAWAASFVSGSSCESDRVLVTLTIYDQPNAPIANDVNVCYDGTEYSASASVQAGETLLWYANETGSDPASAPTATLSGTYTAWAAALVDHGGITCESERTLVTLTIYELDEVTISYDQPEFCQETGGIAPVTINGELLSAASSTYTSGNISSDYFFRTTSDNSACPGTMTVTIPLNSVITSVDVQYNMTATTGHYMSDQHSQLRVVSPGGMAEEFVTIGMGNTPGTYSYNRTGLNIANNVVGGGDIVFELHAGRTFINDPRCNNTWNRVDNGTWTVTVYYTAGHNFSATPAGLAIDSNTGDIDLEASLAGTYEITYNYTDGNCNGTTTTTVTILPKPAAPAVSDLEVCEDGTEHTIVATPPAGTTLVWYTDETGNTITTAPSGINTGTYSAWAASVSADGCESDRVLATLTINEAPAMPVPSNVNVCYDGSEHTASATVEAGATLVWYTSETGSVITTAPTATAAGTYSAWAAAQLDACESDRVLVTLTIYDSPDAPTANDFEVCFDGTEYSATATASAGSSVIYYTTQDGNITTTAPTATLAGTYTAWTASVDDISGCESERVLVTLTINPLPEGTISYGATNFCPEGTILPTLTNNVTIVFTGFAVTPDDGSLDLNETTGEINLATSLSGTYIVEYRFVDENGCLNTANTTITIDQVPDASIANDLEVCFDGSQYSASATAPVGASIEWYTSETGTTTTTAPTATNPGTYTAWAASVGNTSGCESSRVLVTLIINPLPAPPVANNLEVCYDGTLHSASATSAAGTSIVWYTTQTGTTITTVPTATEAGTYTAWAAAVDNTTLCESQRVEVTLIINALPALPIANDLEVCFDGSQYSASAAAPEGASIIWYTTQNGSVTTTAPTGTAAGIYTAWAAAVDNITACESERVLVTLTINDTPDAPVANDMEVCFDGTEYSATATASAGSTGVVYYTTQDGNITTTAPTATNPGTYTAWAASVDGSSGCESERVLVTLTINPLPEGTISYGATNFCPEGTILPTLTNNVTIVFTGFAVTPDDGSLDLDENTGEINLATSLPGTYIVEYRFVDENGCLNTANTTITIDQVPDTPIANDLEVCFDGSQYSASATAPAGVSIKWYTSETGTTTTTAPTATNPGTYTAWAASVGNTSGCESSRVLVTLIIKPLPAAPTANNMEVCYDGIQHSASVSSEAGTSIVWYTTQTGTTTTTAPTATEAGTYTAWAAAVDNTTLCESQRVEVTLIINALPALPIANDLEVCFDGSQYSASAAAPEGASIIWYTTESGSVTTTAPTATAVGIYTAWAAAVDNVTACESERVLVTLTINDTPDAPVANDMEVCFDGTEYSATAAASAGSSVVYYTTQDGNITTTAPTATGAGTYTAWAASVDDISGCESERVLVTLIINPLPEGTISYGATNFCPEGTILPILTNNVTIVFKGFAVTPDDGGLDLNVDNGEINLTTSLAGTYVVEYRFVDENGCLNTANTTVTIDQVPDAPVANDLEVCFDGSQYSASATAPAGASIEWYTSETGTTTTTAPTAINPGTYTAWAASVGNTSGCESSRVLVTLLINPLPAAPAANNLEVCYDGTQYSASASSEAGTLIVWYTTQTGTTTTTAPTATEAGTYTAWAAAVDNTTLCESQRVEVTLIINALPALPMANDLEVCSDGSQHSASATAPAGSTIIWYTTESGPVTTTAPTGTAAGIYTAWAAAVDNITNCESERVLVTLTINDTPDAPVANDMEVCFDGTEYSAIATAPAGSSVTYYTTQDGNTTTTAPTATLAGTYTAWAASVDDISGCESGRILVTLTINPLPEGTISYGGTNFCPEGIITPTLTNNVTILFTGFAVTPDDGSLDLNVDNGEINLATSLPGTYVIEYRFLDENGCLNTANTTITIGDVPDAPVVNDLTVCFDGSQYSASATAPAGASIEWYTSEIGNTTTTAPTAINPGTYTAWATSVGSISGCESSRILVTLIINPLPAAPTANNMEVCYDGTQHSASATFAAGTSIVWYTTQTGTTTTIAPTATDVGTYTAWAAAIDNTTLCESQRVEVTLTINVLPALPVANDLEVCYDGTQYSASATAPVGSTIIWYTTESGSVTTIAPTAIDAGIYTAWAASVDNITACEGERVLVTLTINDTPNAPVANDMEVCFDGTEYSATATAPAGSTVTYYTTQDGNITTTAPTATEAGTYTAWAASVDNVNGCESSRVLITLTINPLPEGSISYGGTNFCPPGTLTPILTNNVTILFTGFAVTPDDGNLDLDVDNGEINLSNSLPGTYIIEYRFMDENNCLNTATTTITVGDVPDAPIAENLEVCYDGSEYTASATVGAGSTLIWYTTESGDELTTAPAATTPGTYTAWAVAVNDISGCESVRTLVTFIIKELPEATLTYGANNFCPVGTATATITTSSDIVSSSFSVDPATGLAIDVNGNIDLETSVAGSYTITYSFTGSNNCSDSTSVNISIGEGPQLVSAIPTDAICAGEASGTIEVQATDGLLPYTFELLDEAMSLVQTIVAETGDPQLFENLFAGNYFVKVYDTNSCGATLSDTIIVDEPDAITIDPLSVIVSPISCNGLTDGALSLSALGGSGELEYTLLLEGSAVQGPATGLASFANLDAGTYVVSIEDEAGCIVLSDEYVISEPEALMLTAVVSTDINCAGDEATIEASANEGTGPFSFTLWFEGVQVDGPLAAVSNETVTFSGITTPGTYTVQVIDANNCETSSDVEISEPTIPATFNLTAVGDTEYCEGGIGVEMVLDGSESGTTYELILNTVATGNVIAGTGEAISFGLQTTQGNYIVMATEPNSGCSRLMDGSVDVIVFPLPTVFAVTGGGEYCEGEAGLEISLEGSETGVNYLLLLNGEETGTTIAGDDTSISFGLQTLAGTYTVKAVNATSGCENLMNGSTEININPLPVAVINASATEICEGANVTLTASGGSSYLWTSDPAYDFAGNETAAEVTVVLTGTTTFYLEATNGCGTDIAQTTITVVAAPVVDLGEDIAACDEEIVILDAGFFENVSYLWSDASTAQTLEVTEAGTYSVVVTNLSTNCVSSDEVTVTYHALPLALVAEDQSICLGDSVFIGAEEGITPIPVNSYLWTSEPVDASLTNPTISNPKVSPSITTTYTLVETYTETGCTNANTITITVIDLVADAGEDKTICTGETVTIGPDVVDEALIYSWTSSNTEEVFDTNVANPTVNPDSTTTYTLSIELPETGCSAMATVVVNVSAQPQANAGTDLDICIGESAMLGTIYNEPMPANTYLWISDPVDTSISDSTISNPTVSPLVTTTYTLIETYVMSGCTNENSVTVTVHEYPLAEVIDDRGVCEDETISLGTDTAQPGFTHSWTSIPSGFFSQQTNPSLIPGLFPLDDNNQITFILEVSNGFCSTEEQVVITVNAAPELALADDMTFCSAEEAQNQSIGGDAVDGYTYRWTSNQDDGFSSSEANPVVSPLVSTIYSVLVTDTQTGCFSEGQVSISISNLSIEAAGNPEICENETIALLGENLVINGGQAPYQYFWTDSDGNSVSSEPNPAVEAPFADAYTVMVMDQQGCFVTETVLIEFTPSPEVALFIANMLVTDTYAIFPGQYVSFEALPSDYSYYEFYVIDAPEEIPEEEEPVEEEKSMFEDGTLVQAGEFNTYSTSELQDGQKIYVLAYAAGCPGSSDTITIVLNELPNAFTPDSDGINDMFGIGAELTIFSRWGQKVFEGTSGWDGSFNGRKVSPGTYYYLMNMYDQNNKKKTVTGSVTVIIR